MSKATLTTLMNRVKNDGTKEQEIQLLEALRDELAGTGTYLRMLFSADMVGLVSHRIREDVYPDIYGDVANQRDQAEAWRAEAEGFERKMHEEVEKRAQVEARYTAAVHDHAKALQAANDAHEATVQDLVDRHKLATDAHSDTVEELMLAERRLRMATNLIGKAFVEGRDVTVEELKTALSAEPPELHGWSGMNEHAFDYAVPR